MPASDARVTAACSLAPRLGSGQPRVRCSAGRLFTAARAAMRAGPGGTRRQSAPERIMITPAILRKDPAVTDEDSREGVAELVDLWSAAAQAYMNGDLPTYAGLARHGEDYTLMPPNGGDPRRGFDGS